MLSRNRVTSASEKLATSRLANVTAHWTVCSTVPWESPRRSLSLAPVSRASSSSAGVRPFSSGLRNGMVASMHAVAGTRSLSRRTPQSLRCMTRALRNSFMPPKGESCSPGRNPKIAMQMASGRSSACPRRPKPQLPVARFDARLDRLRDLGDEPQVDLVVDEVVKKRGQRGVRVPGVHQVEDVLGRVKAAGPGSHRLVDHDGEPLHLPQRQPRPQVLQRGAQEMDGAMDGAGRHPDVVLVFHDPDARRSSQATW